MVNDDPVLPRLLPGQVRCTEKYFHGRDRPCGQAMGHNDWSCHRCMRFKTLGKDQQKLFCHRMAGKLSRSDINRVKSWREGVGLQPHDIVGQVFNADISQSKLSCLRDGEWINDEIINATMLILEKKHSPLSPIKPSHIFSTFFYSKLAEERGGYNYASVKRWTKCAKDSAVPRVEVEGAHWLNVFLFDKVYIPINVSNTHWFLAVLDMESKVVRFHDSLGGDKNRYFHHLCRWLKDECEKLKLSAHHGEGWSINVADGPKQLNGYDCGVFTLAAAETEMLGLPILYDQSMMPFIRLRVGHEIIVYCSDN